MQILSHRGYWKSPEEKNTREAFERSFSMGFGTETDIRDYRGNLVISHDIPDENSMLLEDFFSIYVAYDKSLPLALNVKADGLQEKIKELIQKYQIQNYFMFDMSVPDGLVYIKHNLTVFTRMSEYEKDPSFYDEASGVWLDEFYRHWITKDIIASHLKNRKKVCIVSPDLHQRDYKKEWQDYKEISQQFNTPDLMICTDFPEEARGFYYD